MAQRRQRHLTHILLLYVLVNIELIDVSVSSGDCYGEDVSNVTVVRCIRGQFNTSLSTVLSAVFERYQLPSVIVIQEEGKADTLTGEVFSTMSRPTLLSYYEIKPRTAAADILHILEAYNHLTPNTLYFLVLCSTSITIQLLNQVNHLDNTGPTQGVLTYRYRWFITSPLHQLPHYHRDLGNVTHVTAVVKATHLATQCVKPTDPSHYIYSAMWTPAGRRFEKIGEFTIRGLNMISRIFPNEMYGFNKRRFTVTLNMWGPFLSKYGTDDAPWYEGMCMAMLQTLAHALNFTYVLTEPPDGGWGLQDKDGRWLGIVGQLKRKTVDISFAPLAVSSLREEQIDFAFPFYLEYTVVLYSQIDPGATKITYFIDPLHWIVWVLILTALPVTAIIASLVAWGSPEEYTLPLVKVRHSLWFAIGALVNQNPVHVPTAFSSRFVIGFFWMFCLVVVATYSGNLVAFLTVKKVDPPFTSLEELSHTESFMIGVAGGTIWNEMFETSTMAVYQRIWMKIVSKNDPDSGFNNLGQDQALHLDRIAQGGYALVSDLTSFQLLKSEDCTLAAMDETFFPMRYAISMQNNSAYRQIISNMVIHMQESGLLDYWRRQYWPNIDHCNKPQGARSLDIQDVQGVFAAIVFLLFLGFLIFLFELVTFKCLSLCKQADVSPSKVTKNDNNDNYTTRESVLNYNNYHT